eukprot:m.7900 g.7900  ORF g.7900 m.7900 type:complete len:76 (+) comp5944_c0_seq1:16-243(+)
MSVFMSSCWILREFEEALRPQSGKRVQLISTSQLKKEEGVYGEISDGELIVPVLFTSASILLQRVRVADVNFYCY